MIRLLSIPVRGNNFEEDTVCLCDPRGAYLRDEVRKGGERQIIVKGLMQGTPGDYARALSDKLGQRMIVKECSFLDPCGAKEARQIAWDEGYISIILVPA